MKIPVLILAALAFAGCGLSQQEKETARKHFATTAEQKCKCDKLKADAKAKPEEVSACIRDYEKKVKYMGMFFDVVKPSAAERAEAAKAGDEIEKNCKM